MISDTGKIGMLFAGALLAASIMTNIEQLTEEKKARAKAKRKPVHIPQAKKKNMDDFITDLHYNESSGLWESQ